MAEWIGIERRARRCYGFDEISLVPGSVTLNPAEVDTSWQVGGRTFQAPIIASAMDGVVDVNFAIAMGKLGGLAALNLEGVQTRYENPTEVIERMVKAEAAASTKILQDIYTTPIKEELVSKRIQQIKQAGVPCAVSSIPQRAERFGAIAHEAGCDIFVVQSTVTTVRHIAKAYQTLDFRAFIKQMQIPVIIGTCVS